jgi:hypothetical protein
LRASFRGFRTAIRRTISRRSNSRRLAGRMVGRIGNSRKNASYYSNLGANSRGGLETELQRSPFFCTSIGQPTNRDLRGGKTGEPMLTGNNRSPNPERLQLRVFEECPSPAVCPAAGGHFPAGRRTASANELQHASAAVASQSKASPHMCPFPIGCERLQ